MYTFSQLIIPYRKINRDKIGIISSEFHWYVASPYYQFLGLLAKELRISNSIKIAGHRFGVNSVNFITSPSFEGSEAQFTCLSPVAVFRQRVSAKKNTSMHLKSGYLLPDEREYLTNLKKDLIWKYNTVQKQNVLKHLDLELQYDQQYIEKKNNRITKVITLENGRALPEQVRGVLAPLSVKAEPDILRLIYDAGLGQLNNYGFGMVEVVHSGRTFN
jgi:CRISPR-associated endoribonuclease Cas6